MRAARTDPCDFLRLALTVPGATRRDPMPEVHVAMQQHLTRHRLALVELPRDHGKTTQVCWRVLWELGRNPQLRVKIVCASEAIARDRSRFLRSNIEHNRLVQQVFPHLTRGELWTATGFSVTRQPGIIGPTVAAFGIGAASTGTRADLLICDDVVDVKAIYSKACRERTADDFLNNLLNLMEPNGRFWGLSTLWQEAQNYHKNRTPLSLVRGHLRRDLESLRSACPTVSTGNTMGAVRSCGKWSRSTCRSPRFALRSAAR